MDFLEKVKAAFKTGTNEEKLKIFDECAKASEKDKEQFFDICLKDFNQQMREKAAQNIHLLPTKYEQFLKDPDPSIRIIILKLSPQIASKLTPQVTTKQKKLSVLEVITTLMNDSVREVRLALAEVLAVHLEKPENLTVLQNYDKKLKKFWQTGMVMFKLLEVKLSKNLQLSMDLLLLFKNLPLLFKKCLFIANGGFA